MPKKAKMLKGINNLMGVFFQKVRVYLEAAKNVFFPSICFACGKKIQNSFLCFDCLNEIEFLYPPLCRLCSKKMSDNKNNLCADCRKKQPSYDRMIAITAYKEPMVNLIHLFKYKHYDYLANFFFSLMANHLKIIGFDFSNYDFVTSVPMHYLKLKERGYNQAAILAQLLANYFKILFKNDIIYERRYRPSQTKLPLSRRKENIKNAFGINGSCKGKQIVIVDDIFTSGATIEACANLLKAQGAESIAVITLSKA